MCRVALADTGRTMIGKTIDTKQHGHLKSRSISGPEDTIGGTAEPRQKLIRGGGGGAPVHYHNMSFVICNWIFVILDWILFQSMWISILSPGRPGPSWAETRSPRASHSGPRPREVST